MAVARAVASERAPSLRQQEEALEKEAGGANVQESWEQPQWEAGIWARTLGALRESIAAELRLAGKERTAVRRATLRRLFQREHLQQELRRLGKAFYVERL